MFKQFTVAVATAGLALASGSAIARDDSPAHAAAPNSPAAAAKPAPSPKTRYCTRLEVVTGSIVQGRVCKTLEQWRAEGVDPTKAAN